MSTSFRIVKAGPKTLKAKLNWAQKHSCTFKLEIAQLNQARHSAQERLVLIESGQLKPNPKKDKSHRRPRARYGFGPKGERMAIHMVKGEKTGVHVTEFKLS